MKVPTDAFLSSIRLRKVYYFSTDRLNTPDKHFWVCLQRTPDDILVLSCCTSKLATVESLIRLLKLSEATFVFITPADPENPFWKETFVNCNFCQTFTLEEFRLLYESDKIEYSGEISEAHFQQILDGIQASKLVDGETKALLPKSII